MIFDQLNIHDNRFLPRQIYQFLWYLGDRFRHSPINILFQQMKGCDSIKIEAVSDSPTDPLRDKFSCLKYYSRTRVGLEEVSLNRHYDYSSTDTSYYSRFSTLNNIYCCSWCHRF